MPDPIDMTVAVTAGGIILVIESDAAILDWIADGSPWFVEDFRGLATEPGIYRVIARDVPAIDDRYRHFQVEQYEECRIVPSGCFVAVPQPGDPTP